MKYKLNFSFLNAISLQREKISHREITEVFFGDHLYTIWDSILQYSQHGAYYYIIGFSTPKRFLQIVLSYDGNEIYFFHIKVAGLIEISKTFSESIDSVLKLSCITLMQALNKSMAAKQDKKIFNPFEGRDREEVWKEIRENSLPITHEEAMRRLREAAEAKQKKS